MAFQRPTIEQLIERVDSDIKNGLNLVAVIRRSFVGGISRAIAGLSHMLHGHLDWISKQTLPDTSEEDGVQRWANLFNVPRKEATIAQFKLSVIFNDVATIASGTVFLRSDGSQYTTDAEVASTGAETIEIQVTSELPGASYNPEVGEEITLESPILNVESTATVASIVIDAEDREDLEDWRSRVIDRLRQPPLGGSVNDYKQWALEVAGVTRAWVFPLYGGAGKVGVSFVEDGEDPIIPGAPKVQEVTDYIEERKPVTAILSVFAPNPEPMDITIGIKPNTIEVQNAITAELSDLIARSAEVAGSYKSPSENNDGKILLSKISQSISIASGVEDNDIVEINGGAPANVVPSTGGLVTLGAITWQTLA